MIKKQGRRDRKKEQMRQDIADAAAQLFAQHGFDSVSVADIAQVVDISEQTVYNYFPNKQDLVLDRAEEIREQYFQAIVSRPAGASPASALRTLAQEDIERYRHSDLKIMLGEFPAVCSSSPSIRRFALEVRDQQTQTVARAITQTCPTIHPAIAHTHAAALVSIFQMITDRIGQEVLASTPPTVIAADLTRAVEVAFNDLDSHFHSFVNTPDNNLGPQPGN